MRTQQSLMRKMAGDKMYNIEVGDIVIYCPEFYAEGSRHDTLYELISLTEGRATIRATNNPNNVKDVAFADLELSFSMNDSDDGMPW